MREICGDPDTPVCIVCLVCLGLFGAKLIVLFFCAGGKQDDHSMQAVGRLKQLYARFKSFYLIGDRKSVV